MCVSYFLYFFFFFFFFSSRRRHTRYIGDWSSDVCSSDLGDGKLDLVVVGEWMAVRVFHQEQGRFVDRSAEVGLAGTEGWWNTVTVADLNGDGHPDLVLGNLGLNTALRASPTEPARMYLGDFAHNGGLEQVITSYRAGTSYPIANREEMVRAIPSLARRFPTYRSF